MSAPGKLTGARLWTVFLTGPGETIRDKSDVTADCGEPPAKRHPRSKANRGFFFRRGGQGISDAGCRNTCLTPAKRRILPVTILRGITRSHPEHGS